METLYTIASTIGMEMMRKTSGFPGEVMMPVVPRRTTRQDVEAFEGTRLRAYSPPEVVDSSLWRGDAKIIQVLHGPELPALRAHSLTAHSVL